VLSRLQASGQILTGVLVEQAGVAKWVPVKVVAHDGDRTAIEGKVAAGARVLVSGHIDLMDGSHVKATDTELK
jgi:hypothetical protein